VTACFLQLLKGPGSVHTYICAALIKAHECTVPQHLFHPLTFGPAFLGPAFSGPAFSSPPLTLSAGCQEGAHQSLMVSLDSSDSLPCQQRSFDATGDIARAQSSGLL